jgi:polyhydroxybutyrate depolymerase
MCNFGKNQIQIMNKTLLLIIAMCFSMVGFSQQLVSWDYDGNTRKYREYVPSNYDGSSPVPLIIALHGLGDNINNFSGVGFQIVADTAGFITVYPEALVDPLTQSTAWNSGAGLAGFSLNADVDDVGFINALIDTVSAHYNIDQSRVYATGFSMGGFMSNRLACELNDRIASIASVAGTIGGVLNCNPGNEIPVCHFHGTDDTNVGYGTPEGTTDNTFGTNVADWISFWTNNNGCGNIVLEGQFPNTFNDGYTIDYLEYGGCTNNNRVVHYKINGADHVWLPDNQNGTDIFYVVEIWKFFLGLSPNNLSGVGILDREMEDIGVYPNPTSDVLRLENLDSKILNVSVFNTMGQKVLETSAISKTLDVSSLKNGVYQLMVATEKGIYSNSFIKE